MVDKEKIKGWITGLQLPMVRFLESNLNKEKENLDLNDLDVSALVGVFIEHWKDLKKGNHFQDDFINVIHGIRFLRNKYFHASIIITRVNEIYKDLDTLIDFATKIGAVVLKEEIKVERDKEIRRIAKGIRSETDKYIDEPIDIRENDAEVLAVSAAETIHLIKEHLVHSCPDERFYKPTDYITFRLPEHGEMRAIYEIETKVVVPKHLKSNLEYFDSQGLNVPQMDRLVNYIKRVSFKENDRFYLLKRFKELPHKPRPRKYSVKTQYYSLQQLLGGKPFVEGID